MTNEKKREMLEYLVQRFTKELEDVRQLIEERAKTSAIVRENLQKRIDFQNACSHLRGDGTTRMVPVDSEEVPEFVLCLNCQLTANSGTETYSKHLKLYQAQFVNSNILAMPIESGLDKEQERAAYQMDMATLRELAEASLK